MCCVNNTAKATRTCIEWLIRCLVLRKVLKRRKVLCGFSATVTRITPPFSSCHGGELFRGLFCTPSTAMDFEDPILHPHRLDYVVVNIVTQTNPTKPLKGVSNPRHFDRIYDFFRWTCMETPGRWTTTANQSSIPELCILVHW